MQSNRRDPLAALAEFDTPDRGRLYSLLCELGVSRAEIVPDVAARFRVTRSASGREALIHLVTPFARCSAAAVELGLVALADSRREVRYRACGLLAHSGRRDVVPALRAAARGTSAQPARRAIAALEKQRPFPNGTRDPFLYFHRPEPAHAPDPSFADDLYGEVGGWLVARGFRLTYLFTHRLELQDATRVACGWWDGYDLEGYASVRPLDAPSEAQRPLVSGWAEASGRIRRIGAALRAQVDGGHAGP